MSAARPATCSRTCARPTPTQTLIGVDLIAAGLRKAHEALPSARLLQADACALPLADASIDAVVSANLLEHIPDDRLALREIARVLRPGARAAIVVPAGPGTYDYYDRFLGHVRRYGRHELASKCADAGLELLVDGFIASLLYPAFWLVKQRNRRRYGCLDGDALEARVADDIERTRDSRAGNLVWLARTAAACSSGPCCRSGFARSSSRNESAAVMTEKLSVVVPAYNEEANVEPLYERLLSVLDPLDLDWELIFSVDPCPDRTRGRDPRAARARPPREDASVLEAIRAADGDARRSRGGQRRRRGRDRLRPSGSAGADYGDGRTLARGLRRGLRAAPHPSRRNDPETDRRVGRLQSDQAHRRGGDPTEHGRLPA